MKHPLHRLVAERIQKHVGARYDVVCDPATGGGQLLSLFVGDLKGRDRRMACADILVVSRGRVRAIVEIEESGFLPTKICGKFLQAAIATHFIPGTRKATAARYAPKVAFLQVLDGSKCIKENGRKREQAELIASEIEGLLPIGRISEYRLVFVNGCKDEIGLAAVGRSLKGLLSSIRTSKTSKRSTGAQGKRGPTSVCTGQTPSVTVPASARQRSDRAGQ